MNGKLKILGPTLLALLVLAGVSPAARGTEFHSELAHYFVAGEQTAKDVFTVKAGTVTCNVANYLDTNVGPTSSELTLIPAYDGCTAFGFVNSPVDVPGGNVPAGPNGGCDYRFTPSTAASKLHIICGSGEYITVTAFNCWVQVGTQTVNSGVTYTNGGSGTSRDLIIEAALTGLTYTQIPKQFPWCTSGTFSDGKYSGVATLFGAATNGVVVGIWHG